MTGAALAADFRAALDGIELIIEPALVRQKSRDFFWFSPILKPLLTGKTADLVAVPHDEAEVIRIAAACARHRVPLTVRGGGTGNYGQAVPLAGGVVLDMTRLDRVVWARPGAARLQAGITMRAADIALQAACGWELRIHPSTKRMATVGGFVAGGAVGVGSITYGQLRDRGAVLGLRVVTVEPTPRIIELRGDAVAQVTHAYGTNGIITEVELPLAPSWPWIEAVVAFADFMDAARFAQALGEAEPLVKKLVTLLAWPIPSYLTPLEPYLPSDHAAVLAIIAEPGLEPLAALAAEHRGTITLQQPAESGPAPLYESSWNHTTLHALKLDKSLTYLQVAMPVGRNLELLALVQATFGDELMLHGEFQRRQGGITNSALPLVRYTTADRLYEIVRWHEAHGMRISDPHSYQLHTKAAKVVSTDDQVAFRRHSDPLGLLNPGKMIGWEPAPH